MKHFLFTTLALLSLLACRQHQKPTFKQDPGPQPVFFISGTYAAFEKSGYCRTWDTLTITRDRRQINVYRIRRVTTYQRNLDDYYYPVEHESATWTGSYDPVQMFMHGLDSEPDLVFVPQSNQVIMNGHFFNKVE